jgi:hypothetical protein
MGTQEHRGRMNKRGHRDMRTEEHKDVIRTDRWTPDNLFGTRAIAIWDMMEDIVY